MSSDTPTRANAPFAPPDAADNSAPDPITQNVESILEFYTREEQKISRSQRAVEVISGFVGRPVFLACILAFVVLWVLDNVLPTEWGAVPFDEAPFFWLQGVVSVFALLTTTVVLIRQNRMSKLEQQRAHLDLQLNLLTEQKTTKLIDLIEELRRDLPMVKDRHDPEATAFQQPTDPQHVLETIDEMQETEARANEGAKSVSKS
jgi:uncharacterized membrane protein